MVKNQIILLITGGADFSSSNLIEHFREDEYVFLVCVLDDFTNGYYKNIEDFENYLKFELVEGDICDYESCLKATNGIGKTFHQATHGTVTRSIENPCKSQKYIF